ncbi:DinB family protein [Paraflavitalea soli]|uniref:DinB family protein n=1 Tax=Paraflavitalea soli TaxID=2315862 RepID=A0A3B7MNK0_9BACT|nr:DinB family protein [Paraflavitalea soli]AXY74526.1 DinB family protein [Paraflavitalea soli]
MEAQTSTKPTAEKELFIKMVISNWELQNIRVSKLIAKLSDEQMATPTAPGRNTGIWILGHLIAVNDGMISLLGLGERLFPELEAGFTGEANKPGVATPPLAELKKQWDTLNAKLTEYFSALPAEEWFTRHNSISPEDFAKEPHRNKLNILINRTNHQSYHLGQLIYLDKK